MKEIQASRGALGQGMAVINEGPDVYVMEDNRIILEPGEALACVAVPELWQGGTSYLYRMSREEALLWVSDVHNAPIRLSAGEVDLDKKRRLFRAYTEGVEYRAQVRFVEECDMPESYRTSHHTNFAGHTASAARNRR